MTYSKEKVEARVEARTAELDTEIAGLMEERQFMQTIKQANWFSEPLRTDALTVLFEQYKKIYE